MNTARTTRTRKPVLGEDFLVETPYRRRNIRKPIDKRVTGLSATHLSIGTSAARLSVEFDASVAVEEGALPPYEALVMPRIGLWTPDEDALLLDAVAALGPKTGWRVIAERVAGRTGKQCRERHHNHLDPRISKNGWTAQEDMVIHLGVHQRGHKWSEIARGMPGRTDNDVKNRYNVTVQEASVLEGAESYFEDEAVLYNIKRLNANAEVQGTPGRFAQQRDNRGVRWTSEEHLGWNASCRQTLLQISSIGRTWLVQCRRATLSRASTIGTAARASRGRHRHVSRRMPASTIWKWQRAPTIRTTNSPSPTSW